MSLITFRDRYKSTVSSAPGTTGNYVISGSVSGYQSFVSADNGLYFEIVVMDGSNWEIDTGCQWTNSSTTLSRGTLVASSSGSAINFTSAAVITVTLTAERANTLLNNLGVFSTYGSLPAASSNTGNTATVGTTVYVSNGTSWVVLGVDQSYANLSALTAANAAGTLQPGAYLVGSVLYGFDGTNINAGGLPSTIITNIIPRTNTLRALQLLSNTSNPGELASALDGYNTEPEAIVQVGTSSPSTTTYYPTDLKWGNFGTNNVFKTSIQDYASVAIGQNSYALVTARTYSQLCFGFGNTAVIGTNSISFDTGASAYSDNIASVISGAWNISFGAGGAVSGSNNTSLGVTNNCGSGMFDMSATAVVTPTSVVLTNNWEPQLRAGVTQLHFTSASPSNNSAAQPTCYGLISGTPSYNSSTNTTTVPLSALFNLTTGDAITTSGTQFTSMVVNDASSNTIGSTTIGSASFSYINGQIAKGNGSTGGQTSSNTTTSGVYYGLNQATEIVFAAVTTDSSPTLFTSDSQTVTYAQVSDGTYAGNPGVGGNQLAVLLNKSYFVDIKVVAKLQGLSSSKFFHVAGLVTNNGGTLSWSEAGSGTLPTIVTPSGDTALSAVTFAVAADNTHCTLALTATGLATGGVTTLGWTAHVNTIEVSD